MANNATAEKTLEIELERYWSKPLEVAEREISEKLAGVGRPAHIVVPPHDKRKHWQMYKDIVSYLLSLTSRDVRLISDPETYELCMTSAGGNLSGDPRTGYFLDAH